MKKNSFVEGTFIATLAIIFVKFLGMIYVFPFYRIIGESGGALYSYAYNVYNLFLNISIAGIPVAISKIISEYNALMMYEAKERAYSLGKKIIFLISIITFFLLFVFSKEAASLILGTIKGGNTLDDVSFVIKSVSFCLLIIPFLSVSKGYLQGHKFITPSSNSQVIEQIVRIAVILMGSYITINVLNKSVTQGVAVAVFGAFVGGVAAYAYINYIMRKHKDLFKKSNKKDDITDKDIIKKIVGYSIPLIIVAIVFDLYGITDMTLIVRTLYKLGYSALEAETITSIVSTWAPKICMIINAVAMGMGISLIPHMVSAYTKKDLKKSNDYFNQAISIVIFTCVPLVVGISFLSKPFYTMFYGESVYGSSILMFTSVSSLFASIYIIMCDALQSLNKFKIVYIATFAGLILNAILDIPFMNLFNMIGIDAFYGAIVATIIGYIVSYIIVFISLNNSLNFNYKEIFKTAIETSVPTISMLISLVVINIFVKTDVSGMLNSVLIILLYTFIGALVYVIVSIKMGLMKRILGEKYIDNLLTKLKIKGEI